MPARVLIVPKSVEKEIGRLPAKIGDRVDAALSKIKDNPIGGVKLHGRLENYYKFRVGDYRIVYKFVTSESRVEIVKVEHRQGVYK